MLFENNGMLFGNNCENNVMLFGDNGMLFENNGMYVIWKNLNQICCIFSVLMKYLQNMVYLSN